MFTKERLITALIAALVAFASSMLGVQVTEAQPGGFLRPHDHSGVAQGGSTLNFDAGTFGAVDDSVGINSAFENPFEGTTAAFIGDNGTNNFFMDGFQLVYYDDAVENSMTLRNGSLNFTDASSNSFSADPDSLILTSGSNTVSVNSTGTVQFNIDTATNDFHARGGYVWSGVSGGTNSRFEVLSGSLGSEVRLYGANPQLKLFANGALPVAGEKAFDVFVGTDGFSMRSLNDSFSSPVIFFQATRTGTAIDTIDLCSSADECDDVTLHTSELFVTDDGGVSGTSIGPGFYSEGSFQASTTGCTGEDSPTIYWRKINEFVSMAIENISCTSDEISYTIDSSGVIPAELVPSILSHMTMTTCADQSTISYCNVAVNSSGDIVIRFEGLDANFSNTGTKSMIGVVLSYMVQ